MMRFATVCAVVLLSAAAFSQSSDSSPVFEVSDVHANLATGTNQFRRGPVMRGGRYEIKSATMVDLVAIAYGFQNDKVMGGPSWLEMNRYDVIAKAPEHSTIDSLKPSLQQLLAERFKLVAHKDTQPQPAYALAAGKRPLLKEATGKEEPGCKPQSGQPGPNGGMIMTMGQDGKVQQFALGPGGTIQYQCRNVSMGSFVEGLHGMFGANLGTNPVLNETGIEGHWNFDLSFSIGIGRAGDAADRVSLPDAIDKQLGLKLELKQVPTPVIVVDSVDEKPTANPSDVAERLKIPPPPTEFEVAALKPFEPPQSGPFMFRSQVQPGGRVTIEGNSVKSLVMQAWNLRNDMLVGAPAWMDQDRYDLLAKVDSPEEIEFDDVWPLVRKLLIERFQMQTHMEERPATAYTLLSVKPRMKKADPTTRTHVQNGVPPGTKDPAAGNPALNRVISCQNITMAQFAGRLLPMAAGYFQSPVLDATGLEGGWDFVLTFSGAGRVGGGPRGRGDGAVADAAAPDGAISIFEAVEKELGLKLEQQKRNVQVLVIDHIERKPIDN